MPARVEGPDPPPYPPALTYQQAVAFVVSGLSDTPTMPGASPNLLDQRIRRLVDRHVTDRRHREQLKAWCRSQAGQSSFRSDCRNRDWNRDTAERNVAKALAMIFLVLALAGPGSE